VGEKPDEIAREIASRRDAIDRKLAAIENRVTTGVNDAKSTVTDRVPQAPDVKGLVQDHPLTSMLAGFGVGFAVGTVSPSPVQAAGKAASATATGAAASGGLLASMLGPVQGRVQEQIARYVEDFTSALTNDSSRDGGLTT